MPVFYPLDDQVLVRRDELVTHQGRLELPEHSREVPLAGTVVAVGPGRRIDDDRRLPPAVKVGQRVVFAKYVGTDVDFDGVKHIVLREAEILGTIEDCATAHQNGTASELGQASTAHPGEAGAP